MQPFRRPAEDVTGINDLIEANVLFTKPPDVYGIGRGLNVKEQDSQILTSQWAFSSIVPRGEAKL